MAGVSQTVNLKLASLALVAALLLACALTPATPPGNPAWVDQLIHKFQSQPVGNPPQSIWRYDYHGQVVYYVPPQCCDQYSTLYDATGLRLCAPDGGLTGKGDGQCADFEGERTGEKLIWQDPRKP